MSSNEASPAEDLAQLGYGEAVVELEEILSELEDDTIDVDLLGTRVERAAALVKLCRDRIGAAELKVSSIVADLEGPNPSNEQRGPSDG